MTLSFSDLAELAGEIADSKVDSSKWMKRERIELEAMQEMLAAVGRQWQMMVETGSDPLDALYDVAGQSFRLGWEACRAHGAAK